jgi:hypothetical protein
MKSAAYKDQATESFEEANALNPEAAIFDHKKQIPQRYVQFDGVRKHSLV